MTISVFSGRFNAYCDRYIKIGTVFCKYVGFSEAHSLIGGVWLFLIIVTIDDLHLRLDMQFVAQWNEKFMLMLVLLIA